MTIYFLPIEPIEERYSIQWLQWFQEALDSLNMPYEIIDPPSLMNNLGSRDANRPQGEVLNIYNTNFYKAMQLAKLMEMFRDGKIKDDDSIFLMDAWNPIITQLEYVRKISKIKFKITGMLHAGTWDTNDFVNRYGFKDKQIHHSEYQWFSSLDRIYVATEYHKNLILDSITPIPNAKLNSVYSNFFKDEVASKLIVTPFPLKFRDKVSFTDRKNQVVFPHRLDAEKREYLFDKLAKYNSDYGRSDIAFIKTKQVCKDKESYYNLLKESKVAISFALQETFGIAMLESVRFGCLPIVPDDLSYKEMYPDFFKFSVKNFDSERDTTLDILLKRIYHFIDNYAIYSKCLAPIYTKYFNACEIIMTDANSFYRYEMK